ncbi:dipeptide epimerase (plasmid) [Haloplanus ruber]|uniref:Dipeptide epimerase n=1 Tax=Haloplanus ruber TaxID=869892 RepID=A0ABD6CUL0_9EURY|nr:dipeptide epimerase [Haloplanus ruber]
MSDVVAVTVDAFDHPLAEPFEISLGTQREASSVLVTVETEAGVTGHGEGSPLPPVTGETQAAAVETVRGVAGLIKGRDVADYRELVSDVRAAVPGAVSALFAVETAILDAYCREVDLPLSALFGGPPEPVTTDMTIPILTPERAAERATEAVSAGYDHLKIKTGSDVAEDAERVRAVARVAPDASLKVDANQGWTVKETGRFADQMAESGVSLELIEQPVPASDVAGLARVRERVGVPIAADEAVFSPADASRIVREGAADVINAKLGKSGPLAVADIAAIAEAADLELMVGCMLESAVGIHTSAHVVAGLGGFDYVDLDGNRLLAADVVEDGGPVHSIAGPGHGVTP